MLYNKNNLAVAGCCGSGTRAELGSVFFTGDGTVATDGYKLVEVSVRDDVRVEDYPIKDVMRGHKPFMVEGKSLSGVRIERDKNLPILESIGVRYLDNERVEFVTGGLGNEQVIGMRRVEGSFPDYKKLIPQGEGQVKVRVDIEYLQDVLKVMKGVGKYVDIRIYGNDKAIRLDCAGEHQKAVGLLMPVRE